MFYVFGTIVEFAIVKCILKKRELKHQLSNQLHSKIQLTTINELPEQDYKLPIDYDMKRKPRKDVLTIEPSTMINQNYANQISYFNDSERPLKIKPYVKNERALRYLTPMSPNVNVSYAALKG